MTITPDAGSNRILGVNIGAWDASAPDPNITSVVMDPAGSAVSMVQRVSNKHTAANESVELWDAIESIWTTPPILIRATFDATISNIHIAAFTLLDAAQQAPSSTDTDEHAFPGQNHSHTLTIVEDGSLALGLMMADLPSSFWTPQHSQTEEYDTSIIGITSSLNWLAVNIADSPATLGNNSNDNSNNSVSIGAIYDSVAASGGEQHLLLMGTGA